MGWGWMVAVTDERKDAENLVNTNIAMVVTKYHLGQVFIIMVMDMVIIVSIGYDIDDDLVDSALLNKMFRCKDFRST